MAKSGPRKTHRYDEEFKAQAVRLSELPGVQVQEVADALAIHPFMLSRWRKRVRDCEIVAKDKSGKSEVEAELKELRKIKRKYKLLEAEHEVTTGYLDLGIPAQSPPLHSTQ